MSRGRLVVHAHFYQPSRTDPFSGRVPVDPSAAPEHDWTARVSAECYRPNAEIGNLRHVSWNLGPTLAGWMGEGDPVAYRGFVAGDLGSTGWLSRSTTRSCRSRRRPTGEPRSAGACAISSSASAGRRSACGCRNRPSISRPCGC